jgi:hypothetical protein
VLAIFVGGVGIWTWGEDLRLACIRRRSERRDAASALGSGQAATRPSAVGPTASWSPGAPRRA